jgi:hypothetical protein
MLEVNPVGDADQRRERRQPLCEGATEVPRVHDRLFSDHQMRSDRIMHWKYKY